MPSTQRRQLPRSALVRRLRHLVASRHPLLHLLPFLLGLSIGIFLGTRRDPSHVSLYTNLSIPSSSFLPPDDLLLRSTSTSASPPLTLAFAFATGRSGTQHLSRILSSRVSPRALITHEQEHLSLRTRTVVARDYRRLAAHSHRDDFDSVMDKYARNVKLPFFRTMLRRSNAQHLVYTGHVPAAFGLIPALIRMLPAGSVRVLRLRRERLACAASLMALGPEEEDPWGGTTAGLTAAPNDRRRWFPTPNDGVTRLPAPGWMRMNRFQRWLWYVDDIECRWQALRYGPLAQQIGWMEDSLENLNVLDGGTGWRHVAAFMGVEVNPAKLAVRDNSVQFKNRSKIDVPEATLREWDVQYRGLVGPCPLDDGRTLTWGELLSR